MGLDKGWETVAGDVARQYPEEATSTLAQYVLEETWDGSDPDSSELEMAYTHLKQYLIDIYACNPDT